MIEALIACSTVVLVVAIISFSCVRYYSSESKRALANAEEKNRNTEELMRYKDSEHDRILKSKETDCQRMADIIKSLMEKQQRFSVDALINSPGQESRNNTKG